MAYFLSGAPSDVSFQFSGGRAACLYVTAASQPPTRCSRGFILVYDEGDTFLNVTS